jgi:hypothetical protein
MWLHLHNEGKLGRLIDLTGAVIWPKTAEFQVLIRRPHDLCIIQFEEEGDAKNFFETIVLALTKGLPLLHSAELGLRYSKFERKDRPIRISGADGEAQLSVFVDNKTIEVEIMQDYTK